MPSYLRKLGIEGLDGNSDVSKLFMELVHLRFIDHLILRGFHFRTMPCLDGLYNLQIDILKLDGLLASLPNFPYKIESLTLVNSSLDEDPMPLLGELGCLTHLKLRNAFTGREMVILHDGFPDLNVLCIEEMWNLKNVQIEKGGMSSLEKLEIKNCPSLESLPEEIGSMALLKELKMVTTKSIATKIRNSDLISKIWKVNINP
ncbi:probable disease resistance protein RF9 [Salvia miltiorrhiza]|uniref:probable disease resistance protein RF9 n=1 Tax=Salvia miltiorrhiza TaxID=226208 RepID=UPI0025ACCEB5|nr:probable disease resistance protein RF9 [Salvia miltiorrhiza]